MLWAAAGAALSLAVGAAPQGGRVVGGQASIHRAGAATVIEQHSRRAAIDWQGFDIAPHEQVRFRQPGADAAALNRIFDQQPSRIFGRLTADGRVLLVNPNGVLFGPGARVDVGSLVAAAGQMDSAAFMTGRERLIGSGGRIVNAGELRAAADGSIVLAGGEVENRGLIAARAGRVTLIGGERLVVDFEGDGLLRYAVAEPALARHAHAADAEVLLSGTQAAELRNTVVNTGVISAAAIERDGGSVRLVAAGGDLVNRGTLRADGLHGGAVELAGERVAVLDGSRIDASGEQGGGRIDVGRRGDTQRVYVGPGAGLRADARARGAGGAIRLWSEALTAFHGSASARGGRAGGDGGFVELSGRRGRREQGEAVVAGPAGVGGLLLLDPRRIVVMLGGRTPLSSDGDPAVLAFTEDPDQAVELDPAAITDQLAQGSDVHLQAHEDIEVAAEINVFGEPDAAGAALTLEAGDDLVIDEMIVLFDGDLNLLAGRADAMPVDADGTADVSVNAPLFTTGGALDVETTGDIRLAADVDTSSALAGDDAGAVLLRSTGGGVAVDAGLIATGQDSAFGDGGAGGAVSISAGEAGLALNGVIRTRGGHGAKSGADGPVELDSDGPLLLAGVDAGAATVTARVDVDGDGVATLALGANDSGAFSLHGGPDGDDVLAASDGSNHWAITGEHSGTLNDDPFSAFATLHGGAGEDRFRITADGEIASIDGGSGADTLDYADRGAAVQIELQSASGSGIGEFAGIETLLGSPFVDTLAGRDAADTFVLTAGGGSVNDIGFEGFETLAGGGGADRFELAGGSALLLDGQQGSDTLLGLDEETIYTLDAGGGGTAGMQAFVSIERLLGGGAADRFVLRDGGSIEELQGGGGADTLDFSARGAAVVVDLGAAEASGVAVFGGLETVLGSAQPDRLIGAAAGERIEVSAPDAGRLDGFAFESFEHVDGAGGDDHFVLAARLSGSATGSAGADRFELAALAPLIDGGAGGADRLRPLGELRSDEAVRIVGVERIDTAAPHAITAPALRLEGADGGIGTPAAPLNLAIERLELLDGGSSHLRNRGDLALDAFGVGGGVFSLSLDGALTVNTPLRLAGAVQLATQGGAVRINEAVSGPGALMVDAGAGRVSLAPAGLAGPLASVHIIAGAIDLDAVATGGEQRYAGPVALRGDLSGAALRFSSSLHLLADQVLSASGNLFDFQGPVAGPGDLALLPAGGRLSFGSATAPGRIRADAFAGYAGHLIVGAVLEPLSAPGQDARVAAIGADRIVIDSPLRVRGDLTILASNIDLNADVAAGPGNALNLIALGDSQRSGAPPGDITGPAQGDVALGGARALLVAAGNVVNAPNIRLDLNGGPALVAVAEQQGAPSFSLASNITATTFDPAAVPLLTSLGVPLNLQVVTLVLSNPAQLVAVRGTPFVDTGVFETELSLVNVLGGGLAMDVFQCEDPGSCAAAMDAATLEQAIGRLRARIGELEARLQAAPENTELLLLLDSYREQLRQYEEFKRQRSGAPGEGSPETGDREQVLPAARPV